LLTLLCALAYANPTYVGEIPNAQTFDAYARSVDADDVAKFLIDMRTGEIRYFDVNLYPLHLDFVKAAIWRKSGLTREELDRYYANYTEEKPDFILGYLTHHTNSDQWDFSFWESDRIQPDDIRRTRAALSQTFFVPDLAWRPDSAAQEAVAATLSDVPVVTNGELYADAPYRALNAGEAVGVLRIVPPGTPYDVLDVGMSDVVLLQTNYADLPPVAGILSTVFTTPLSHVNLRATSWGVPNAGFKQAATAYVGLDGQLVHLSVTPGAHELRLATEDERLAFETQAAAGRDVSIPAADLSVTALVRLHRLRRRDVSAYGAKAANLGEVAGRLRVKVPHGVALPFSAYTAHLHTHGLDVALDTLLADPRFVTERQWTQDALSGWRDRARQAPMSTELLDEVMSEVTRLGGGGMFVRSSTNAEDLPGFNGAGLYDTVPNVVGRAAMERAVKQVWASLYNDVAVLERQRFGVDQRHVQAGVLVQVGVNATAAGVLVTKNLYDPQDDHTFTINAKKGLGIRVVDGERIPEQVLFDVRYPGARVISRSDDPIMLVFGPDGGVREVEITPGEPVLTDARSRDIALAGQSMLRLFGDVAPLDIEWLLEGDTLWIVQVRPLVGAR
jgi:hypothetical protein